METATSQKPTTITFGAKLSKVKDWTIIRLPKDASAKLPSRGQVFVIGTINDYQFQTALEPDGKWGHWFRVDDKLQKAIKVSAGDQVKLAIEPVKQWPEPEVSADFKRAIAKSQKASAIWQIATPMAHWEWIRWIRATNNSETRDRRVKVGISKMENGERRPCCWNRNMCTEPYVSKNGVLLDT